MAVVAPFRGVRFNPDKIRIEDVVTPPYDVINDEDGAAFIQKNPYNMIQLDLRSPSDQTEKSRDRYTGARDRFDSWQEKEVLIRDEKPAIYLYYIDYTHPSGQRLTRKGMVALVGLAEFSEGIVKPHEKTFAGVVSDRIELMDECQAQFSQVFSIYPDDEQEVIRILEQAREPEPLYQVTDENGNTHTLWRVTDPKALARVQELFADKPVYIADGHHRYTTALGVQKRARERNPDLPADSPFNFIMMYLCAREDEGLSVLPTHRLVYWPGRMSADELVRRLRQGMHVEEVSGGIRDALIVAVLQRMDEAEMSERLPAFGVYHPGEDRCFLLRIRQEVLEKHASLRGKPAVLRDLDVVVLSELLIQDYLGLSHQQCVQENLVSYISDVDEALDRAVKASVADDNRTPLLFLLNPTRVEQVTSVADSGEIMPHKSTYFYPKIMTGFLINKLEEDEHIQI
ncbi:DUF1015 domain-containing protein [Desulfolithobacter sp.]